MKLLKTDHRQGRIFQPRLADELNPNNHLYILSQHIDWSDLEKDFSNLFVEQSGAPAKPVRLVTGLLMLEHMFNLSDESVVQFWLENPYWQFFCGFDYLQWKFPINPSSLCAVSRH
jgi:IS5 family transposase